MLSSLLTSPPGLVTLLVCVAVGYRFLIRLRCGIDWSTSVRREALLFWLAFFLLALTTLVYNPAVQNFLGMAVGEWFRSIPRVGLALSAYLMGVQACYEFAPHVRPHWNWPLHAGALSLVAYLLIVVTAPYGTQTPLGQLPWTGLADMTFDAAMLILVQRVGLRAISWARQQERQEPMRLRFGVMLAMHATIGLWMLAGLAEVFMLAAGLVPNLTWLYTILGILCGVSFVISHLIPVRYFVYGARALSYFSDLRAFVFIRIVETSTARWNARRPVPVTAAQVILAPAAAVYRSVIAILDSRKMLNAHPARPAKRLAAQLETVSRPDLEYREIVKRLRKMGQDQVKDWAAGRL